ncbi:pentatricopeptide repeat-containing protein At4g18975, chloroplastic isoform X2 [Medicago truncatula]|uniref:PPR containing plant-like protein n=1 Tax=Medicago truncatula TaxID=3880 RepID=A0A072UVN4_MEDTR|nr:pentatricopeptide repeat-containing protein At4g18975, chloroplastic isoform X2 [Medicago truncatula]KEH33148.1 PPR containing plant-like protein [Medicago truncatula]
MPITIESSILSPILLQWTCLTKPNKFLSSAISIPPKTSCISCKVVGSKLSPNVVGGSVEKDKKGKKKKGGKIEHHLWQRKDSAQSGQKALTLVRTLAKWMLSKGQGATMGTYDTLLLAFDMEQRVDEAESLWNMIIHAHMRSVSKRLFSRMISVYDHHNLPDKIVEVFADMEELRVKPDEDTVRKVASAFRILGQEEKRKLVIKRYGLKWKYIHFNGERVKVRTHASED